MALTQTYVDPARAGEGNVGTGTIGDPYSDLQYALNNITRNATDGDQINIKAGTAEVLAASLTLATYGTTPTANAPLVLRGYTSAANDGGRGEIDCGGFIMWAGTVYPHLRLIDLTMHNFGNNNGVQIGPTSYVEGCIIHKGASSPSGKYLLFVGDDSTVVGCHVYDPGDGSGGCLYINNRCIVTGNYVNTVTGNTARSILVTGAGGFISHNVVRLGHVAAVGIWFTGASYAAHILNNIVCQTTAGTAQGINAVNYGGEIRNNIVTGFSGAGGVAISSTRVNSLGYNAIYNCTTGNSVSIIRNDLTASDVALAADPFTDAANGDFSLTDAAKTALRSLGWPASYLGAHANSDPHITIGALQYGPTPAAGGGGGFPILGGSIVR